MNEVVKSKSMSKYSDSVITIKSFFKPISKTEHLQHLEKETKLNLDPDPIEEIEDEIPPKKKIDPSLKYLPHFPWIVPFKFQRKQHLLECKIKSFIELALSDNIDRTSADFALSQK